jgi:hypothetical protein
MGTPKITNAINTTHTKEKKKLDSLDILSFDKYKTKTKGKYCP